MARRFGKVCEKHPDLRGERVANRNCIGCDRERKRAWLAANPEKARAAVRAWARANKEKVAEYSRVWYIANLEKARAAHKAWATANKEKKAKSGREWRSANPEKSSAFSRAWQIANPEKCSVIHARRRARKLGASMSLTAIDWARYQEFFDIARARTMQTGIKHHVDHDKPLALGGLDHPDNLLVVPYDINIAKGARYASTLEFLLS